MFNAKLETKLEVRWDSKAARRFLAIVVLLLMI